MASWAFPRIMNAKTASDGSDAHNPPLPYSKREQRGWYMYDWANATFHSTVVTLFLGPYLTELAKAAAGPDGRVHPLGIPIDPRSWWGYMISISVLTQIFALPAAGTIADFSPHKKWLMGLFAYTGALATAAMFFLHGSEYLLGGLLFLIANLAYGASVVVFNSFLPEIAPPERRDAVSSTGWGIGYLGGGLLLALNLALFSKADDFGLSTGMAVRINLSSAGIWWALFSVIPLLAIRRRPAGRRRAPNEGIADSFREFAITLRDMRHYPETLRFLIAFLLYSDAVQAVISLSSQFGSDALKISMADLTKIILMVQFVAFFGSFVFDWIARVIGAKPAIIVSLMIWTGVLVAMYVSVRTERQFVIVAVIVALVLGGTQALSRSLFSQMIPKGREAEYFGMYEISDKGTSWMCPLLFGLALQFTGSYRLAILSLVTFFAAGLLVLLTVNVQHAAAEAARP
ncbi:MAG TPA: MFS transporter [Bryobacteraceae bacterium]|nr:MFS transporter [Bryobacteraceae bacterium]